MLTITNECNMQMMARYPDKYFDLAIVDPPYDFSISKTSFVAKGAYNKIKFNRFGGARDKGGLVIGGNHNNSLYPPPNLHFFNELFRVSKHQIVFGGNYFTNFLSPSMAWIYWDKNNGKSFFSDGELAWTSFGCGLRQFKKSSSQKNRSHPTQKPISLYDWIYLEYLPKAFSGRMPKFKSVVDTHLGSGTHAIAAINNNIDLTACELDPDYYNAAMQRIKQHTDQLKIF